MDIKSLLESNPNISLTVSGTDLLAFGYTIADHSVKKFIESKDEKVFTREEVIAKFEITPATLWRWTKHKIIHSKRVGGRVYYPESEINRLIESKNH